MTEKPQSEGITLKISVKYSDILEHTFTSKKTHVIKFKNGDRLTFVNGIAKRTFRNLQRNFPGEHLE